MNESTIRHYRERGGVFDMMSLGGAGGGVATTTSERVLEKTKQLFSPKEIRKNSGELLWQSALSYEDELHAAQAIQVLIEACREIETNHCYGLAISNAESRLEAMGQITDRDTDSGWLGGDDMSLAAVRDLFGRPAPTLLKAVGKVQTVEAVRALVVTAITLKRYELRHGNLPADLAALVPEFLSEAPLDPVDRSLLRYRRNADGGFLLYSVGEDGVDNGGDPSNPNQNSKSRPQLIRGRDWVWPQPASPQEIERWAAGQLDRATPR